MWDVLTAKNSSKLSLLSSVCKKEYHLPGILESGRTLRRVLEPIFSLLADSFKVFSL